MAFYSESIYLDLKKNMHSLFYAPMEAAQLDEAQKGLYSRLAREVTQEDLGSRAYLHFEEQNLVLVDVRNAALYVQSLDRGAAPADFPFADVVTRVNVILHKYLEQPSLLDNLVEPVLAQISEAARVCLKSHYGHFRATGQLRPVSAEFQSLVSVVYTLAKVRGTKNVQKYLGHDVMDLEPLVFFMLANQGRVAWETLFFLLLWLSVVLLAPFDFGRFNFGPISDFYAGLAAGRRFEQIELLVLDFLKSLLRMSSRVAEGTSLCFSVLFRRPALANVVHISETVQWGLEEVGAPGNRENAFYKANVYRALSGLVKDTRREVVELVHRQAFAELALISQARPTAEEPASVRLEKARFVFALVLKLLRPNRSRPVHKTPRRQLLEESREAAPQVPMITNKKESGQGARAVHSAPKSAEEESENIEFLPLVEHVVDLAFECLRDSDSNIRYLAAKELAAIALKLPESLSDELLNAALDGLLAEENEATLHSACLAVGEFCRRGLISPALLPRVIPVLQRAILFEDVQGNYATGSIVRDAACYICWALARSFEVAVMRPFVSQFAVAVLLCALFDKSPNCRKAAAASFQENVGRQGYFPNGIEIVSEMDYFSVSLRSNAYFRIAPFVGHFPEYTRPFLDHLSQVKLFHVEKELRNDAAKSMALIALFDPRYAIETLLPGLVEAATSKSVQRRCGALVGIACLLMTLSGNAALMLEREEHSENIFLTSLKINDKKLQSSGEYLAGFLTHFEALKARNQMADFPTPLAARIAELPGLVVGAGLLKGKGGEITRIALMYLVAGLARARVAMDRPLVERYFELVEEALRTTIYDIHDAAVEALAEFDRVYLAQDPELELRCLEAVCKRIETEAIKDIKKPMCRAVSCFSWAAVRRRAETVFGLLAANSRANKAIKMNDPEVRKYCVKSLNKLFLKGPAEELTPELSGTVFEALAAAINDYTVDKRGDIGLVVREEVVDCYGHLWARLADLPDDSPVKRNFVERHLPAQVGGVVTQLLEPNDRLRLKAGFVLQQLVGRLTPKLGAFPLRGLLEETFNSELLRSKFQEHQNRFFENYDVSLVDDKNFLSYRLNDQFVYFWNIPHCTFSSVGRLVAEPVLTAHALKGLVLSVACPMEAISTAAYECLRDAIEGCEGTRAAVPGALLKLLKAFRNKEKFFVACLKTVQMIVKNDLLPADCGQTLKEVLGEVRLHCAKQPSAAKVISSALGGGFGALSTVAGIGGLDAGVVRGGPPPPGQSVPV